MAGVAADGRESVTPEMMFSELMRLRLRIWAINGNN